MDVFWVGSGVAEQVGRVSEARWEWKRTWLQLLSCILVAHSVLIWKARQREKVETKTEVTGRHK